MYKRQAEGREDLVRRKEPEVSKSAVSALLKQGVAVPYAHIEEERKVGVK